MARTPSNMMPLGTEAPKFNLPDVVLGKNMSLDDLKGTKATVVMFICNHCPYVKHIFPQLYKLPKDYSNEGVSFIGISSNDVENYPDDSPEKMKELMEAQGFEFNYLYDETQEVAKSYDAACTPDFYVFDENLLCVYRGQLDETRPRHVDTVLTPTGKDLRKALDQVIAGEQVFEEQIPSLGCNIKWK